MDQESEGTSSPSSKASAQALTNATHAAPPQHAGLIWRKIHVEKQVLSLVRPVFLTICFLRPCLPSLGPQLRREHSLQPARLDPPNQV